MDSARITHFVVGRSGFGNGSVGVSIKRTFVFPLPVDEWIPMCVFFFMRRPPKGDAFTAGVELLDSDLKPVTGCRTEVNMDAMPRPGPFNMVFLMNCSWRITKPGSYVIRPLLDGKTCDDVLPWPVEAAKGARMPPPDRAGH